MSPEDQALTELRAFCLSLPETSETESFGHPNFRAGKRTFAVFEWVKGRPSVAVRLGADESEAFLLQHDESFETPYGRGQWISVWADVELDPGYLHDLIERGYRSVALKRMIAALEEQCMPVAPD
jgi:predicted DNA-binding protein (MmcQ/YjbR family)